MAYPQKLKTKVRELRRRGLSIQSIARNLSIAKSTVSLWVRDVKLSKSLLKQLELNSVIGRAKGLETLRAQNRFRSLAIQKEIKAENKKVFNFLRRWENEEFWKFCAALLFWCEGSKRDLSGGVRFTNSDPALVQLFLYALRSGFKLDENRFRALVHLHEYHEVKKQTQFWSHITKIPTAQFSAPYKKPHTKIRKREGYPGCISIRYFDSTIAKKLDAIYHAFSKNLGA